MITKNDLIQHFEGILSKLKDDSLDDKTIRELTLLYIKTKYEDEKDDKDDKDCISYFSLGWYIHNFLLNNK